MFKIVFIVFMFMLLVGCDSADSHNYYVNEEVATTYENTESGLISDIANQLEAVDFSASSDALPAGVYEYEVEEVIPIEKFEEKEKSISEIWEDLWR